MVLFENRRHAGRLLAERLAQKNLGLNSCVLALPRGGVPVAWEVARLLHCPMDLVFVKKIGAPGHEELAIGAVSEAGVEWQRHTIGDLHLSEDRLSELAAIRQRDLRQQLEKWRPGRGPVAVKGKTVIVVDDGLATGATMGAALSFLSRQAPDRILVAVPVASRAAESIISPQCDEFVVLHRPEPFRAVGQWYSDFTQVTDKEVRALLQ